MGKWTRQSILGPNCIMYSFIDLDTTFFLWFLLLVLNLEYHKPYIHIKFILFNNSESKSKFKSVTIGWLKQESIFGPPVY